MLMFYSVYRTMLKPFIMSNYIYQFYLQSFVAVGTEPGSRMSEMVAQDVSVTIDKGLTGREVGEKPNTLLFCKKSSPTRA